MFSFVLSRTDELRHIFAPKASYFFDTSVLQKFVLGSLSVREEHLHFKDFIGFSSIQQNLFWNPSGSPLTWLLVTAWVLSHTLQVCSVVPVDPVSCVSSQENCILWDQQSIWGCLWCSWVDDQSYPKKWWKLVSLYFALPTVLTCPFSCGALEQIQIAVVHCQRSTVQFEGNFNLSVPPCFNDIYGNRQAIHSRLLWGQLSAVFVLFFLTDGVLSCQIKLKSLLKVCSPQWSTWSVSLLRIRMGRASPWFRQLSPVRISLHGNKQVFSSDVWTYHHLPRGSKSQGLQESVRWSALWEVPCTLTAVAGKIAVPLPQTLPKCNFLPPESAALLIFFH